jgi:N-acetylmuramoyl-L-alanine amidase
LSALSHIDEKSRVGSEGLFRIGQVILLLKTRKRVVVWITYKSGLKILFSALMVGLVLAVFTYDLTSMKTWTDWSTPLSGKVIAIDAGHGGPDGGAVSREGIIEKHINLAISLYLRDYLQQAGALVVMTREEDKDLADPEVRGSRKRQDIFRRVELVNNKNADILISIHMNSIPSSRWRGAQSFYYPNHEDNKMLATFIQEEIKHNLENTDREAKTVKTVYLLKALKIPSALVEVGFLSNPEESRLLADEKYQKKMAAAIYRGILRYTSGEKLGTD